MGKLRPISRVDIDGGAVKGGELRGRGVLSSGYRTAHGYGNLKHSGATAVLSIETMPTIELRIWPGSIGTNVFKACRSANSAIGPSNLSPEAERRQSAHDLSTYHCVLAIDTPFVDYWESSICPSCPKNGNVPKFPFPAAAAVVPSAGTMTLEK
jgi:hypothetical protein